MQKKSLTVGIFLAALLLLIGVIGLTAEAAISLDGTNYEIELSAGVFDLDLIWDHPSVNNTHLVNETGGVWLLNWSIIVETDATLVIDPVTGNESAVHCTWLKMNSTNLTGHDEAHINVTGHLFVNDTMITGWNYTGDCNQSWNGTSCTFRPYIYIIPLTDADTPFASFLNSTIGYLGFDMDNKYGIVYEDADISGDYDSQGWMHNCTVMENYIGIDFQGCENMNVTNTWMNNTHEVGIVYTIGGTTANGAHGGFIGDHPTWTHRTSYTSVAVDYCNGTTDAMGIRLYGSDNITMDQVNIQDARTEGLQIDTCANITASNVTCYLNTYAANDYNIYLIAVTNSSFDNCTAFSPDSPAPGGNWHLNGTTSYNNNFTTCQGYSSSSHNDFYINTGPYNNTFTSCVANNSNAGFYCLVDNNNTFIDCVSHNHTLYDYKFYGSVYNTITNGYANDSAVGVYIYDGADYNTVTGLDVNRQTSYAIQIGTADDVCHNNSITSVTVVGTTAGDGIFIFGNCTYNNISMCSVTDCDHANASGIGIMNYSHHNTIYGTSSSFNGFAGLYLRGYINNNDILSCTFNENKFGIDASGSNVNNNSIHDCWVRYNDWGLWMWASASNANQDNYFNDTVFSINTYAGMDIGRVGLSTYYNNTVKNNSYGIEVRDGAEAFFTMTLSYNSTNYDWVIENTSAVDIYSTHILYPNVINTVATVTASISHDAGDGLWNLYTKPMIITIDVGTCDITVTQYTDTYVRWTGTALAGDLTQYIGSLREGRVYDLLVDGVSVGRASAVEVTMLENTTYRVTFPYTDGWSTKTFAVRMATGGGNGGTPAEEPPDTGLDSDGDGYTDAEEIAAGSDPYDPASTPLTVAAVAFLGLDWYWWIVIAVIIFFVIIMPIYFILYPKQWKKFKKALGL